MTRVPAATDIEHEIGPTGLLAVRLRSGDARLRAVDGSVVRVHDNDGDLERRVVVERGDGSLSLRAGREASSGEGRSRGTHSSELVIDVPTGATVVVETSSAEVTIDGLTGDQRYRTASGDIRLRDVSGRLTVETMSGDVDVLAVGTCSVTARTVSGDLSVRTANLEAFRATTTSGDVRMAGRLTGAGPFAIETVSGDMLMALAGDVRLEASTVTGDVTSEADARTEGTPGRRVFIVGDGVPTMTVRSMSGDVSLMKATAVTRHAEPPAPPSPPAPPRPAEPLAPSDAAAPADESPTTVVARDERPADDDASLSILRALERGEIDVAEAGRRLEALDSPTPTSDDGPSDD